MVVSTYHFFSSSFWVIDCSYRGVCNCTVYLYYILVTKILGISAFYHDSAACIVEDGKIIAAAQEERFTRKKHDSGYPFHAIEFVLNFTKTKLSEIDNIIFFEKPFLKFERLLETYVAMAPKGFLQFSKAMPTWLREKLFQNKMMNLMKLLKLMLLMVGTMLINQIIPPSMRPFLVMIMIYISSDI